MSETADYDLEGKGLTTDRDIGFFGPSYVQMIPASCPMSIDCSFTEGKATRA
jgi:hypothetical protein